MTRTRGRSSPPTLRLREPADVLGAIPYLLGYHPTDSVVVLALRGTRVLFAAREDLPRPGLSEKQIVGELVGAVVHHGASGVIVVGFGSKARVGPLASHLRTACQLAGVAVREVLRADRGRYWSYLCTDPTCCPTEGSPYDPAASPVAAQATYDGRVAFADRDEYVAQLSPIGGPARLSMAAAVRRADERLVDLIRGAASEEAAMTALVDAGRAAIGAALARHATASTDERPGPAPGGRLDDDEVAWLAALLDSGSVQDIAWQSITADDADHEAHRSLWMDVVRRTEPDLLPAPGTLFAFAAWQCGDCALAGIALERVLAEDPEQDLARLIYAALARGMAPPSVTGWLGPVRPRSGRRRSRRSSSRRAGSRPT
jgi:hypothetical protein